MSVTLSLAVYCIINAGTQGFVIFGPLKLGVRDSSPHQKFYIIMYI
jgi:hypothetical protein